MLKHARTVFINICFSKLWIPFFVCDETKTVPPPFYWCFLILINGFKKNILQGGKLWIVRSEVV